MSHPNNGCLSPTSPQQNNLFSCVLVLSVSGTEQSVGNAALLPETPRFLTQIILGLEKEQPPKGFIVVQPDLNCEYHWLVFPPLGRRGSLLPLHKASVLTLQGLTEELFWKWGVVLSALLKAEFGPVYLTFQNRKSASTNSIQT